jgi:hypothetical protein
VCNKWPIKPKQGVFLSITCKCARFIIAKRHNDEYELMQNGVTLKGLGYFDTADEAKEAIK